MVVEICIICYIKINYTFRRTDNHAILEGSADASSLSSQMTKCCAKALLVAHFIAPYTLDPLHDSYKKSIVYCEV